MTSELVVSISFKKHFFIRNFSPISDDETFSVDRIDSNKLRLARKIYFKQEFQLLTKVEIIEAYVVRVYEHECVFMKRKSLMSFDFIFLLPTFDIHSLFRFVSFSTSSSTVHSVKRTTHFCHIKYPPKRRMKSRVYVEGTQKK